jgi:hypothetical protein
VNALSDIVHNKIEQDTIARVDANAFKADPRVRPLIFD